MSKILYIHNTNLSTKTANLTQVISMCNAFCEAGKSTTLLLPRNKNINEEESVLTLRKNFRVHEDLSIQTFVNTYNSYKLNKNLNFLRLFKVLRKRRQVDEVIFVRNVLYLIAAVFSRKKVIYESHNTLVHNGSSAYNFILEKILIYLSKKKNLVLFVSISENLNQFWLKKGIPAHKSVALHDGFDTKAYEGIPISNNTFIPKTDKPTAVYTGNIHPNRGIKYIIELARICKNVDFYVVGGPDSFVNDYKSQYNLDEIRNITFLGSVPHIDIVQYQNDADILLAVWSKEVPTINYCSPLKLFEYMACGKPILAFGYPTIREVLEDNKTGYICEPDSVPDMLVKMDEITRDFEKAKSIGENAKKVALLNYSWLTRVKEIDKYLK